MSDAALARRTPDWVRRVQDLLIGGARSRRFPRKAGGDEIAGRTVAVLTDLGLTPEDAFAARAAEDGAPGRAGFDC